MFLYGEENSHRFEIYINTSKQVCGMCFRIDFTQEYEDVLRCIVEFLTMNDLVIIDMEHLEVQSSNYESIKHLMESSAQVKRYRELCSQ